MKIPRALPRTTDEHFEIRGPARVAILPDVHIPHHSEHALDLALEHCQSWRPTHILFNGDLLDAAQCSQYDRDPARINKLADDCDKVSTLLKTIRKEFATARVIYKCGNHDDRVRRYVWQHAPELAGLPQVTLQQFLGLDEIGVQWVASSTRIKLGALVVIHGHEYRTRYSGGLTSPATTLFRKAKSLILASHHHQRTEHSERTADGKVLTAWTTGCLCDLGPEYSPLNNWGHGFALVKVRKEGDFDVENLRVMKGRIYA